MGLEILRSKWLTKSGRVYSIGLSLLTNTLSSSLHQSFMINTKPFIISTKKTCPWRNLTFDMLPFDLGGTHEKLLARVPFTSSTIYGTFVCSNGEASCWM
jgi:hypothetical protein